MIAFELDQLPRRVVFGAGTIARVTDEVATLGACRVAVVADPYMSAVAEEVCSALGDRLAAVSTDVRQHVPTAVAEQGVRWAQELDADLVLSIGGGSAVGLAKIIARDTGVQLMAVPTTYAGSEMTPIWGETTDEHKRTGRDLNVLPKVVVYDPELTLTMPPEITGPSGCNALAHAVEACYAEQATPITTAIAEEGIRALVEALPGTVADGSSLEHRSQTQYGAMLAGMVLAEVGVSFHHVICHVLGGAYDLPHATTHAVVLPHSVALLAELEPAVYRRLGELLAATRPELALHELVTDVTSTSRLDAVGLTPERVDSAIGRVLDEFPEQYTVAAAAVRRILEGAATGSAPADQTDRAVA